MPSVSYLRDFLVVRFDGGQIDCRPFQEMPVALDALGESERLAVVRVHFVDAIDYGLEVSQVLFGRLDLLEQTLCGSPVFAERVFVLKLVGCAFDLC